MEVLLTDVLVFGGAFNPPTNAHIELANEVRQQLGYNHVIYVPSKMSYIKEEQCKDFAFKDTIRFEMLCKIALEREWMIASDYEINSDTQPRTYDTLRYLQRQGYRPHLLFGSDKLKELKTGWRHVEDICSDFGIVCMQRNHDDCFSQIKSDPFLRNLKDGITLVTTRTDYQSLSSTKIRQLFIEKKYEEISKYVPKELHGLKGYDLKKDTI